MSMNRFSTCTLAAALIAAAVLVGCGAEPTATEAVEGSGQADPAACQVGLDVLADQIRVDATYDYEPSDSPAELAAITDAVVTATLGELSQDGEDVTAVLENLDVISGDTSRGRDGDLAISWYVGPQPRDLGDTDGISVLAFLIYGDRNIPTPEIEGLWFGCGRDGPARSMIVEPVEPGWPAGPDATIDKLSLAVTDPAAAAANATETFTMGSLTCYHNMMEDSIGEFAEGFPGFDTPEEAVDAWWAGSDGRFRDDRMSFDEELDVPEARYRDERGNAQLVLGLVELPAGGWAVETTQACVDPATLD